MPFNSLAFLILLTTSWLLVVWLRRPAYALIVASLVFYLFAGPLDTTVFLLTVGLNWLIQLFIMRPRWRITAAVLLNIGLIFAFKYKNLLFGGGMAGSYTDTGLPLGISFYCFQALAYHIDVIRHQAAPARSFASFFLFKSFFPQLVAGPIVRAPQFLPQIERLFSGNRRRLRLIAYGLVLCLLGLFKKVVLADSLAPIVDEIFVASPESAYQAWLGAVLFAFQIYFDFSGYSDIAIGAAYLLGLRLPLNFLTPYMSTGPRDFWQRWHISLSTWIRDYLYIPLGGGRGGWLRAAAVLVGSMALAGLWHGANGTFVIWGAGWGIYILICRSLRDRVMLPLALRWPLHMAIVVMLWVFFRSPSFGFALDYLTVMLDVTAWTVPVGGISPILSGIGIAGLFLLHAAEYRLNRRSTLFVLRRWNGPFLWGLCIGLSLLLILLPSSNANPFIYFRF
ncbi:MBOAT family O-acyltransferase [Ferrovibrio terrae]|uniref:MBOAT family O-acyltransferase n=1 Tax=Ferrovibrio terrae TaxID=2594003 RepID=UPI003137F045